MSRGLGDVYKRQVLCGDGGWTLKEYYLSDKFTDKLKLTAKDVTIMTEEKFLEEYVK